MQEIFVCSAKNHIFFAERLKTITLLTIIAFLPFFESSN